MNEIVSIEKRVNRVPPGEYNGVLGGYEIVFMVGKTEFTIHTRDGTRGIDIPVKVISKPSGSVIVYDKKDEVYCQMWSGRDVSVSR